MKLKEKVQSMILDFMKNNLCFHQEDPDRSEEKLAKS